MRLSGSGWFRRSISVFGLFLCLAFIALATVGAAVPAVIDDGASAASATGGRPPIIQVFKATPMVLDTPDSAAVYTFKVKNATNMQINEAGSAIKNISNPSAAALNGTATGLPASAIPADDSGKFITLLIASNTEGSVKAELTLSFSEKLLASGIPAEETEPPDNGTEPRSPKWLEQYPSPFSPARSPMSGTEPKFFDCPSDCDYCLKPEEAESQGMGERCSEERCYHSPDNQQNWYCYKPAPGWCCYNLQVTQTTKDECTTMGGAWFLNQYEALERCQPMGYCCRNGNIYQTTRSECTQTAGTYYTDPVEANERCQPPCWCCAYGQVFQTNQSQCAQSGGNCYTTQYEALERCHPPCWCCAYGKVFQTTQPQCLQLGGTCYANQYQAYERCQPPCWCCAYGQVFQTNQSQCIQSGGDCYTTQAEALRYCQQQSACWCCLRGQVFQTNQSQCIQSGGNCYSSYEQAQQYCRPITTPPLR